MRLIDAGALISAIKNNSDLLPHERIDFIKMAREAPTIGLKDLIEHHMDELSRTIHYRVIEAEPVRHGVWEPYQTPIETRQSGWICTCCSGVVHDVSNGNTNYCPNCGAKMDGGTDDAD